jgi:tetratricopeptide (TPR) repeat protein
LRPIRGLLPALLATTIALAAPGGDALPAPAPGNPPDGALLEGLSALHQGRFAEGQARFRDFLTSAPGDPRGHLFLAFSEWWRHLEFDLGSDVPEVESHLEEAIRLARERLDAVPGDSQSLGHLGTSYIFLAQYRASQGKVFRAAAAAKKGKSYLEKAIEGDPDLADPRFPLGAYNYYADKVNVLVKGLRTILFLPGGNAERGLAQLHEVTQRGRYFRTEAHLLLAVIYQGRHERRPLRALHHLGEALKLNPDSPVILGSIGELEIRMGRFRDARTTLRRCLQVARSSTDRDQNDLGRLSRVLLAEAHEQALDAIGAMREIEAASRAGPLPPEFRQRALAVGTRAALRRGDQEWLRDLYRFLEVPPQERVSLLRRYAPEPSSALIAAQLEEPLRLLDRGRAEPAREMLQELSERYPASQEVRFHLARTWYEQGRFPEAESAFRRITDSPPGTTPGWLLGWRDLYLGRCLAAQGRGRDARDRYERAAEQNGFRAKDLARALLGPDGSDAEIWPRGIFGSGPQDS